MAEVLGDGCCVFGGLFQIRSREATVGVQASVKR
jgi:hypothetical protein